MSRFRPHCFEASITARFSRASACSTGWATDRECPEGDDPGDPQFDRLLDQPLLTVSLGERGPEADFDREFPVHLVPVEDDERGLGSAD